MQMACASRSSDEKCAKADRKIRRASKRATEENGQEAPIEDENKGQDEWTAENQELEKTMMLGEIVEHCMIKQHACLKRQMGAIEMAIARISHIGGLEDLTETRLACHEAMLEREAAYKECEEQ